MWQTSNPYFKKVDWQISPSKISFRLVNKPLNVCSSNGSDATTRLSKNSWLSSLNNCPKWLEQKSHRRSSLTTVGRIQDVTLPPQQTFYDLATSPNFNLTFYLALLSHSSFKGHISHGCLIFFLFNNYIKNKLHHDFYIKLVQYVA